MFENPRRGRQVRNFGKNVPKILDLKLSSEQIFSQNCRWVPLLFWEITPATWFQSCDYAKIQMGYLHVIYTRYFLKLEMLNILFNFAAFKTNFESVYGILA